MHVLDSNNTACMGQTEPFLHERQLTQLKQGVSLEV